MRKRIQSLWEKEGIRYLFFGGATTAVSTVVYWAALALGINYLWSNVISWVISVAFAFVTNKWFVFRSKVWSRESLAEAGKFAASRLVTLVLGQGILYAGVEWLRIHEMVAKILSQILEIAANYLLSKVLVFVKGKNQQ